MSPTFTRREVIQTLAAAATAPPVLAAAEPRRTVGIVGAGMAGVSLAWLLDGQRDVVLIESGDAIGGNVQSVVFEFTSPSFTTAIALEAFVKYEVSKCQRSPRPTRC